MKRFSILAVTLVLAAASAPAHARALAHDPVAEPARHDADARGRSDAVRERSRAMRARSAAQRERAGAERERADEQRERPEAQRERADAVRPRPGSERERSGAGGSRRVVAARLADVARGAGTSGRRWHGVRPFEEPTLLEASLDLVSAVEGGVQRLALDAGLEHGRKLYWFVGSASGASGSTLIGGFRAPLVEDAYTQLTLTADLLPWFPHRIGFLDGYGRAEAAVVVPAGDRSVYAAAPLTLHHLYLVIDPLTFAVDTLSNPVALDLR